MKKNHLAEERKLRQQKEEKIHVVSSLKQALSEIEELEAYVEAIKSLKQSKSSLTIKASEGKGKSEAVAVAMATDWHLGCTIRPEQVSGLNTFDVAIAKKRIVTFFERTVRLIRKERQDVKINELILFLGGDF